MATPLEERLPPPPVAHSSAREFAFQALAVASLALGAWYLHWRWTASLNRDALWFAIPLALAETLAFGGSLIFFLSLWRTRDTPVAPPPSTVRDVVVRPPARDRPLIVDVFYPTYDEDPELVRLSIRAGKALRYPHPLDLRLHVLDDGRREAMKRVAEEEGVGYLTRANNAGFKAGNLRNGIEQTGGDFIVICDADTRVFPELLERTLGYFRDPRVAWVQTPQWFHDLEEGVPLPEWLARRARLGAVGRGLGRAAEALVGPVRIGADPFANDPQLFYDVIQRRRNWCNASFCCGAGSVHRREAVMEAALRAFADQVAGAVQPLAAEVDDAELRRDLSEAMTREAAREIEFTPYRFHVSEDIYTSIELHSDRARAWRSVYHPEALSKMLSPQDLLAWTIQRYKYAGGTLDIFWNDNPLRRPGLSGWQKLCYGATIYSYFSPLWTIPFLLAPILYFLTGIAPIAAYDAAFLGHALPFLVMNKLAFMVGAWGVPSWRGEQYYLAFFWLNLRAIVDVLRRKPIKFHVTPKTRQARTFLSLVQPQLAVIGLTVASAAWAGWELWTGARGNLAGHVANLFWAGNNLLSLSAIVMAALHRPSEE